MKKKSIIVQKKNTKQRNMITNEYFRKMKPMTNFEIDKSLSKVKNYKGTFMSDQLPKVIEGNSSYVINLDKHINDGTHWVAVFNDPKSEVVEYFDSFGASPNKNTEAFLRTSGKGIRLNTIPLQHILSKACGLWAIWYIKERSKGKPQYDVIYSMTLDDPLENEKRLKKYFNL